MSAFGISIMSNKIMVFAKEASIARARARAMIGLQQSFCPSTWIVPDDQFHVYKVMNCSHLLACTCYEKFLSLCKYKYHLLHLYSEVSNLNLFYFTEKK